MSFPFYRSPDELSANVTRLVKVLGPAVMRVFHAIVTRQRILVVGYNHAAVDISDFVLSIGE